MKSISLTVFSECFSNFADIFCTYCRCAYGFLVELELILTELWPCKLSHFGSFFALQGIIVILAAFCTIEQSYQMHIWVVQRILYYKVYNSNCYQVGHDLTDHVHCISASMPEHEALQ